MCRMIAATGTFDPARLAGALRTMSCNANAAHPHEYRARGDAHRHEDGWGAVWLENGALRTRRSIAPCFEDPSLDEIGTLRTRLLVLHARRASRGGASMRNTHPFVIEWKGSQWTFVHNGQVDDLGPLVRLPGIPFAGDTDSERLFHHLLARFDRADRVPSLLGALAEIERYTSMNAFLVAHDRFYAIAWADPKTTRPQYFTLWEGRGDDLRVVSSEPVPDIGCEWAPLGSGAFDAPPLSTPADRPHDAMDTRAHGLASDAAPKHALMEIPVLDSR